MWTWKSGVRDLHAFESPKAMNPSRSRIRPDTATKKFESGESSAHPSLKRLYALSLPDDSSDADADLDADPDADSLRNDSTDSNHGSLRIESHLDLVHRGVGGCRAM